MNSTVGDLLRMMFAEDQWHSRRDSQCENEFLSFSSSNEYLTGPSLENLCYALLRRGTRELELGSSLVLAWIHLKMRILSLEFFPAQPQLLMAELVKEIKDDNFKKKYELSTKSLEAQIVRAASDPSQSLMARCPSQEQIAISRQPIEITRVRQLWY